MPLASVWFLLPALVVFGLFAWYPLVRNAIMAFQTVNFVAPPTWIGFENFRYILGDPQLAAAIRNTVVFTLLALVLGYPVPLLLAIIITEARRGATVLRVLAYLPVALPPVVAVLLWKWFYDPGSGLFNSILRAVGLPGLSWLESSQTALLSLVIEGTWATAGATMLVYLAALSGISTELYEAAEIDGASILQRIWHITLPRLRGVLLVMLLLQVIGTLQVFTEPYIMTDGGPNNATVTVMLLVYRYAFGPAADYGAAAALSLMLAVVLGILSAIYLRVTRAWST